MTQHEHHLTGCAPSPLAHYLKAIGLLRIVSEQIDSGARGAWRDEHFVLWTTLDRAALEAFFLETWQPTPLVSPWNKGSGLMGSDDPAVSAIANSKANRFGPFRNGITAAKSLNAAISGADAEIRRLKDEPKRLKVKSERDRLRASPEYRARLAAAEKPFKALKANLIPDCRRQWRGTHLDWLEAALVVTEANEAKFPSMLGTGGNDGRFDMTNNAMRRLGELFDLADPDGKANPSAATSLTEALWGTPTQARAEAAIGQFLPGAAGGANSTNGPAGEPLVNRWDFLLALEGAVAFRAHATRKLGGTGPVLASAPFAAYGHAAGYGSASMADEGGRGEQWMPLWQRPTSWRELKELFGEGRAQVGRSPAHRPLDLARAFSRLGVARGIHAFVRYGYIERNGQSNLAVALDRFRVGDHLRTRLVDDLSSWMDRLRRKARDRNAPARLQIIERRLADATFDALRYPDEVRHWQAVLLAAAEAEALVVPGGDAAAGPIPTLQAAWVEAADDGSPEFRLALALGAARHRDARGPWQGVRGHFLPLDKGRLATTGGLNPRVGNDPGVVIRGEPLDALLALVERRLVESESGAARRLDLEASPGTGASLTDLAAFIDGAVDDSRILRLARAFAALRLIDPVTMPRGEGPPPEHAWLALRLAHLPRPLPDRAPVPADPAIVRRLRAGDGAGALALTLRRLSSAGQHAPLRFGATDPHRARRWGAALAFPISPRGAQIAARHLFPRSEESADAR